MKPIDSNLQCPSCRRELRPARLACDACGIRVEGPFRLNEFASLGPDDLHFLRIFVQSEGRIRDMEAALGLSYPTIRTRLTALKHKLARVPAGAPQPEVATGAAEGAGTGGKDDGDDTAVKQILEQLESGALPFDEALRRIRQASAKR